uniref:LSM domain-containing protein n=1 Tax=Setaria digitata TaxID=48799 RepID=A0A915PZ51_9BILA
MSFEIPCIISKPFTWSYKLGMSSGVLELAQEAFEVDCYIERIFESGRQEADFRNCEFEASGIVWFSWTMDLFSSRFDAEKVLNDLKVAPTSSKSFESIDKFEEHLCQTNATLVAQLQKLEVCEIAEKLPVGLSREARLSLMCAQRGRSITEPPKELRKWSGTNLFQTEQRGPMRRLEQCVQQGRRVCIVLRGRNSVNSFILAKVVAFDKHWNLLIRDGDESFKPPVRMKHGITKSIPTTGSCRYFESKGEDWEGKTKTVWRRHLSCSLIRGDDIVLILISPRFSSFLWNDRSVEKYNKKSRVKFQKAFSPLAGQH